MRLSLAVRTHVGCSTEHDRLAGWPADGAGPVSAPLEVTLTYGATLAAGQLHLAMNPSALSLTASTAGGGRHYFRLADATLRPLPAVATLILARGDAYIAVSRGVLRLVDRAAIARFLHVHDSFNAERLAEAVLHFVAEESGQPEFPEDVTVLVAEAR